MAIFGPRANLWMNTALAGAAVVFILLLGSVWVIPYMDFNTQQRYEPDQPVPFSHEHHVTELGLDCRYCHTSVETSWFAGMPPSETCMTCHSQLFTHAAVLEPVRASFATGEPLRWTEVYRLQDYVYFDHSIHVAKGVGCTECHGPIGDMKLTWKWPTLYMAWCLDCHRNPAPRLRPLDQVFNPHWKRTPTTPSGEKLMAMYKIYPETLSDCGVCHR